MKHLASILILTSILIFSCSSDDSPSSQDNTFILGDPVNELSITSGPLQGEYNFENVEITRLELGNSGEHSFTIECGEHSGSEQLLTFDIFLPTVSFPLNSPIQNQGSWFRITNLDETVQHPNYTTGSFTITITRKFVLENSNPNDYVVDITYQASLSDGAGGDSFTIEGVFTNMIVRDCTECPE